jgi:predicted Ser/Thr protein kinase
MRNDQEIPILYHKIRDSFLLKKKIGKGGFGVIYSAENIQTKEPLAVKFEKIKNNSGSSNLLKEAKILHLIFKKGLMGKMR